MNLFIRVFAYRTTAAFYKESIDVPLLRDRAIRLSIMMYYQSPLVLLGH